MTARIVPAPRRTEGATCDPSEARELLDTLYGGHLRVDAPLPTAGC